MLPRRHISDGPTMMDRPLGFEEVLEHRHLACGRYAMCLAVVVRRQWISFSCRGCSLWRRRWSEPEPASQPGQVIYMPLAAQR